MSLEKATRTVTDIRLKGVPVGKSALLALLMGMPGKFIPRLVRYALPPIIVKIKPGMEVGQRIKQIDFWTRVLGLLGDYGLAYTFANVRAIKNALGPTLTEALTIGTMAGGIDALGQSSSLADADISNRISRPVADKIREVIMVLRGIAPSPDMAGPKRYPGSAQLGAFPEAATSAFGEKEEFIASPEVTKPVDPVQRAEEILAEKSKI